MTAPKALEDQRPRGQPTKYEPEYCDRVIAHMAGGLSFESFAGLIGVHKDTLYEWRKHEPDFSDAVKKAFDKCRLWWERLGVAIAGDDPSYQLEILKVQPFLKKRTSGTSPQGSSWETEEYHVPRGNAVTWIFNMKNRFHEEWRDRHEHTGGNGEPLFPLMDYRTVAPEAKLDVKQTAPAAEPLRTTEAAKRPKTVRAQAAQASPTGARRGVAPIVL